ncbi:MAG: transposase [Verrucomicrobia bacterium]|nr:transposase [Verrucomicrobiota bacterium]
MNQRTDYDGAWKEALELYLQPLLEFCFPDVAENINWHEPIEFLDKELQEVTRNSKLGKQRVDKLVRVIRKDGRKECILIHVEVQSWVDKDLPLRMYRYHHRIADRYDESVVSLAILADEKPRWRPDTYEERLWGYELRFRYPVCKLMDFGRNWRWLEEQRNPAAVVIAAYLATQRTRRDMSQRQRMKWELTRRLYERGYSKEEVLNLFRLIDWLMRLPDENEVEFRKQLVEYEKEKTMPYVTSIERLGRKEGLQKALRAAIVEVLEARFSSVPGELKANVDAIADEQELRRLHRKAVLVPSIEEFEREF